MGRGAGGSSRGGGGRSGGSRGGSFRSSSSGGRGRSSSSMRTRSGMGGHIHGSGFHMHRPIHAGPVIYRRHYIPVHGALGPIIAFVAVVLLFMGIIFAITVPSNQITRSTIERTKLAKQYVVLSEKWYDDSAMGWISSGHTLEQGLRRFYNETGVQPYLVITDQIDGNYSPTGDELWEYANQIYDETFSDEGHMVFIFQCEDGGTEYMMAACTGNQAKTVVDEEALEILYDYIDSYFYSDMDEDEMFSRAFSDAAKRIMDTQMSTGSIVAIVIGVIVVAVLILLIVVSVIRRSREKAEETERILNTPLEKYNDPDEDGLKEKYNE